MITSLMRFYRDYPELKMKERLYQKIKSMFPEDEILIRIEEDETLSISVGRRENPILFFCVTELFNGCAYLLCHNNVFTSEKLFPKMDEIKEFIAREANYSCLMATETSERCFGHIYSSIMDAYLNNGWKLLDTRINHRTSNKINLLIKEI